MRPRGFDPRQIIDDWREAYAAANGREPDSSIKYVRGWFVLTDRRGLVQARYRRFEIEAMTSCLRFRATPNTPDMEKVK